MSAIALQLRQSRRSLQHPRSRHRSTSDRDGRLVWAGWVRFCNITAMRELDACTTLRHDFVIVFAN